MTLRKLLQLALTSAEKTTTDEVQIAEFAFCWAEYLDKDLEDLQLSEVIKDDQNI